MQEAVAVFNAPTPLVGIVTTPRPDQADPRLPAVVVLNAGLMPRVGPHRISVRIARRLAEVGCTTLRFDLAGLGDSERRQEALPYAEGVSRDVTAAIDYFQCSTGVRRVMLAGICSGADNALQVAVSDARVVGAVLVDGLSFAYKTPRFHRRDWARRIGRLASRRSVALCSAKLAGAWRHSRPVAAPDSGTEPQSFGGWVPPEPPPRAETASRLRSLVERGVALHAIYTGGVVDYYNYRDQFVDSFPDVDFKGRLVVEYLPTINHTFTELQAQDLLLEKVSGWVRGQCFQAGTLREVGIDR